MLPYASSFYLILRSTISLDIQYVFFYLDDAGSCKLHSLTYITPSVRIGSWDISGRLFQTPRTPAPRILFNRSTPCLPVLLPHIGCLLVLLVPALSEARRRPLPLAHLVTSQVVLGSQANASTVLYSYITLHPSLGAVAAASAEQRPALCSSSLVAMADAPFLLCWWLALPLLLHPHLAL
jgi:hypothetical protein